MGLGVRKVRLQDEKDYPGMGAGRPSKFYPGTQKFAERATNCVSDSGPCGLYPTPLWTRPGDGHSTARRTAHRPPLFEILYQSYKCQSQLNMA